MKKLLLTVVGVAALLAFGSTAFADVWTDQEDYTPGSIVTISGDGYLPGETVDIVVGAPYGGESGSAVADENGAFVWSFTLPDDLSALGEYTFTASGRDSGLVQSGAFTDANSEIHLFSISPDPVDAGEDLTWSASARCTGPAMGPNSCTNHGSSVNGPVPNGYTINLLQASGACGTAGQVFVQVDSATTTGGTGTAGGTISAPLIAGFYAYRTEHPSQPIDGNTWGAVGQGTTPCVTIEVQDDDEPHDTTTEVDCVSASVVVNQTTTCTATVTDTDDDPTEPQGTVGFSVTGGNSSDADFTSPSCTLAGNGDGESSSCSVAYTPSAASTHTIAAAYEGSADHNTSNGSFDLTVNTRATTTTVTCDTDPVTVNDTTECTITVEDSEVAGTASDPSGTVSVAMDGSGQFSAGDGTFDAGPPPACTLVASAGPENESSCSVTYEPTGASTHNISATYSGSNVHDTSNDSYPLEVVKRETSTTIVCAPDVQQVDANVTCTATAEDVDGNGTKSAPSGDVDFERNDIPAGSCTLADNGDGVSSSCSMDVTSATPTVDSMQAAYSGPSDVHETSESELVFIVFYDPSAGFVTGGGWINSPAGAYVADASLTGKANFGFVAKYKKGATVPEGNTEFQFHAGGLNFKSTDYEWLVVQGGSGKAQFKGTGTINGSGNYGFMLTVSDGGKGGVDKFRIKIWDKDNGDAIVYDNQMGGADNADATTVIGGGSIVIHAK